MINSRTSDGCFLICPYCGHKNRDPYEYVHDEEGETECGECGKHFLCWLEVDVTYYGIPIEKGGEG